MIKKYYNLHLSVVMLLHMPIPCPQNLQLAPSMLTLLIWLECQCNNITLLLLNHGYEPNFIGQERIGMVEQMMGEVDRRSQKDGSQIQVFLRCRYKGAMKSSFGKLDGNLSF